MSKKENFKSQRLEKDYIPITREATPFKTNLVIFVTSILTSVLIIYGLNYIDNFSDIALHEYLKILLCILIFLSTVTNIKIFIYFLFLILSTIEKLFKKN